MFREDCDSRMSIRISLVLIDGLSVIIYFMQLFIHTTKSYSFIINVPLFNLNIHSTEHDMLTAGG